MADSPNTRTLSEFHSRRSALAGIAGTLAVATGIVGAVAVSTAQSRENPDAELIKLCRSYCEAWRVWEEMAERDGELDAFNDETLIPLYDAIKVISPRTLPGVVAKAKAALLYEYDIPDDQEGGWDEQGKWLIKQLANLELVS